MLNLRELSLTLSTETAILPLKTFPLESLKDITSVKKSWSKCLMFMSLSSLSLKKAYTTSPTKNPSASTALISHFEILLSLSSEKEVL